jgi:hypothetical protein
MLLSSGGLCVSVFSADFLLEQEIISSIPKKMTDCFIQQK